jgi:hypothetical protein
LVVAAHPHFNEGSRKRDGGRESGGGWIGSHYFRKMEPLARHGISTVDWTSEENEAEYCFDA